MNTLSRNSSANYVLFPLHVCNGNHSEPDPALLPLYRKHWWSEKWMIWCLHPSVFTPKFEGWIFFIFTLQGYSTVKAPLCPFHLCLTGHWTATLCLLAAAAVICVADVRDPPSPPPSPHCGCGLLRRLFISEPFWFLFLFCSASFGVFVSPCRRWADIILWKGNDPTVLRLCMCAAHCNGLTFYCLPHTNPTTEGMRWHLQGAVCELQPHMKEWPLKMIKEITILGCTTLLSCLARCSSPCPGAHEPWLVRTYARTHS